MFGVSFENEWPSTRGFAALSSSVVFGLTCTMGVKGFESSGTRSGV